MECNVILITIIIINEIKVILELVKIRWITDDLYNLLQFKVKPNKNIKLFPLPNPFKNETIFSPSPKLLLAKKKKKIFIL